MHSQPVGDGGAAHLSTDRRGKVLMSAQYGGGSIAIFPLTEDGSIGPRLTLVKHEGASGVVARRQAKSHAHWVGTSPANRFASPPDLGRDALAPHHRHPRPATPVWLGVGGGAAGQANPDPVAGRGCGPGPVPRERNLY